jgi:membrane-bound lytic murein transglycosylase D
MRNLVYTIFNFTKQKTTIIFSLGMLAGVFIVSQFAFRNDLNKKPSNEIEKTNPPKLYLPQVPESISFAGEKVPLEKSEVTEAFDRELIFNYNSRSQLTYILKLSQRYFPMIEKKLKENNVPEDFKYLCVAESNLQNLTSSVGAKGFWQFMKETGPGFGLEISDNVDERYDMEKSTDAACKYLKLAFSKFGNWTAAAASYNCGMARYDDLATFQQTKFYYDLLLPDETNRYIFRILSFKYLMENAKELGYLIDESNGYQPHKSKTVTVTTSIPDLSQWALNNGTNFKMLKILNPWLRDRSLTVKPGKNYIIKLPQ